MGAKNFSVYFLFCFHIMYNLIKLYLVSFARLNKNIAKLPRP